MKTKKEWIELLKADVMAFNEARRAEYSNAVYTIDLRYADLRNADLSNADLRYADLRNADLSNANLRNANWDFSVFPLWCGSLDIKTDMRLVYQLCYHICRLKIINKNGTESKTGKVVQSLLTPYANKFHRVDECGKIK